MKFVHFLFLLVLMQNYQILHAKYWLVQVNDEIADTIKLEAEETLNIPIHEDLPGFGKPKIQIRSRDDKRPKVHIKSRDHRIIGGKEVTPHSEPWLALLCYSDVPEMW